jgi:hypothetical protein
LLWSLWTKLFPFRIDVIFQEFTETVQRQIQVHVPKDFTHSSRSFILFLARYIPICASQVSSSPQCYKQRYLKYFWLLLQCSRGLSSSGFLCSVGG